MHRKTAQTLNVQHINLHISVLLMNLNYHAKIKFRVMEEEEEKKAGLFGHII